MSSSVLDQGASGALQLARDVTGVVLCGGQSRRMGFDKALAIVDAKALMSHSLDALAAIFPHTLLACGAQPRYGQFGVTQVLDDPQGVGPLGGLRAALLAAPTPWIAVLACDIPRPRVALLRALVQVARSERSDVCLLDLPRGSQPMFGLYSRRCLAAIDTALAQGRTRMVDFHGFPGAAGPLRVNLCSEALLGYGLETDTLNVNTPDELEAARHAKQQDIA